MGINGTISRYESRSDATSNQELLAVANSYIKYKWKASVELTISSSKDFLVLGNKYHYDAPINELDDSYLVTKKISHIIQAGDFIEYKYEYTLSNSYDTEDELNYFDNQRSKNAGNIEEGSFITRNIDILNNCTLYFSDLAITEIPVSSNNVLNATLNAPFTQ